MNLEKIKSGQRRKLFSSSCVTVIILKVEPDNIVYGKSSLYGFGDYSYKVFDCKHDYMIKRYPLVIK